MEVWSGWCIIFEGALTGLGESGGGAASYKGA